MAAGSPADLLRAGLRGEEAGALDEAAGLYRQALAAAPGLLEAHVNLAGLLWRLEDFAGSLRHAHEAVALAPGHPLARRILGSALLQANRLGEAERQLREALRLQPDLAAAQMDLAWTLLLAGRLQEGWPLYEQRWRDPRVPRPPGFRIEREWPGPQVALAGETIVVHAEQGAGDVLQALRYLPLLRALGARVACCVPRRLVPLVQASFPQVSCLEPRAAAQAPWHVACMQLPGRFDTSLATIPRAVPYLRAPEAARRAWQQRLAPWSGRRKVGLAWSGSLAQANNRNRAVALSLLLPLARLPGVQCFSLQAAEAGAYTDAAAGNGELVDFTAQWPDFGESAAMIGQLDLVITVDTAVAHLAGALGTPAWLLLPPNPDWRWLLGREDSPWYPTARLFRRAPGEPRRAQVARVLAALQERGA